MKIKAQSLENFGVITMGTGLIATVVGAAVAFFGMFKGLKEAN